MKIQNKVLYFSIALILIVFLISFVSADETEVIVKGLEGYVWNITLNVIKPSSGDLIISLENDTDAVTGLAKFKYSSATQTVSYYVVARSNGKIIATKKPVDIGNYSTGPGLTTIELMSMPASSTPKPTPITITNNAANNGSDENETASDDNSTTVNIGDSLSSFSFSETLGNMSSSLKTALPWIGYGALALVLIALLVYGILWLIKNNKKGRVFKNYGDLVTAGDKERPINKPKKIAVKSQKNYEESQDDDVNEEVKEIPSDFIRDVKNKFSDSDALEEAERKIKEAQEEINRIKSRKSRVTEAQKNFERAKKELEEAEEEF